MIPPWEQFPTYTRYTIGWRMGSGEQYRYDWSDFLKTLPVDFDPRLEYLRSHRPAPLNWGDTVLNVLYPATENDQKYGCSSTETAKLLELGVIEHDAAYQTWRNQQSGLKFPWSFPVAESPENAARYCMRDFWFFSRQLHNNRADVSIDQIPNHWASVRTQLETGKLGDVFPENGLLTISQMLCAGDIQPPWNFGLTPDDFADSFEMDVGFCDAYRLWIMTSFDDDKMIREMLSEFGIPNDWTDWINEQTNFGR